MSRQFAESTRGRSAQPHGPSGTSSAEYAEPSQSWGNDGPRGHSQGPRGRSQGPERVFVPRDKRLLGLLKDSGDPHFRYFEIQYLQWIYKVLTDDWALVQEGASMEATNKWVEVFMGLELDQVAQMDMALLAQQSTSGRALANQILWEGLTTVALSRDYEDLSSWFTSRCNEYRKRLDRPPKNHRDRGSWNWERYSSENHNRFSPMVVPREQHRWASVGTNGEPLMPPRCWQRSEWV